MNKTIVRKSVVNKVKPVSASSDDIFDLKSMQDAPQDVKSELRPSKESSLTSTILALYNIKSPLTVNELIIGLYRKFKIKTKRSTLVVAISRLSSQGIIKKTKGVKTSYGLVK